MKEDYIFQMIEEQEILSTKRLSKTIFICLNLFWRSPNDGMANVLDSNLEISECEPQSSYYIHFLTNIELP